MFKRSILKLNSSILLITLFASLNFLTASASTTTKTSAASKTATVVNTTKVTPAKTTTVTMPTKTTTVATAPKTTILTTTPKATILTANPITTILTATPKTTILATIPSNNRPNILATTTKSTILAATNIPTTTTNTTPPTTTNTTPTTTITTTTTLTTGATTNSTTTSTINIKDFGAHSIDEKGYVNFDSSQAINKAIQFAKQNGVTSINFGSGRFYARDICLESNITYYSTEGAELIASADIQVWHSVLYANNKSNIAINGLTVNGNKQVVFGNVDKGSMLIEFSTSNNIAIKNCYLYNNNYAGIKLRDNCNYITVKNNTIYDTDCGIITQQAASNNLLIDGNTIYGSKENQNSEPISIFNSNSNGLAHDITITNNILHDKSSGHGILVVNATRVLIKGNTIYNTCVGINIGFDCGMTSNDVTASSYITITENDIYNCSGGINGELNNSTISKNSIHDLKGSGIWLLTPTGKPFIGNIRISDNVITNINSIGTREDAIRLQNTTACLIEKNTVSDTRPITLHWFAINITGANSNGNVIQNNTNLGATTKYGYQIYIQNAQNTTVQNNTATILNQGTGSILTNNIIK